MLINKNSGKWSENWPVDRKILNHGSFYTGTAYREAEGMKETGEWAGKEKDRTWTGACGFSVFSGPFCEGCVQGYRSGPKRQCCHWELQTGKVCNLPQRCAREPEGPQSSCWLAGCMQKSLLGKCLLSSSHSAALWNNSALISWLFTASLLHERPTDESSYRLCKTVVVV